MREKQQFHFPTTVRRPVIYLLVQIFQEAIKDFQEVLNRLFMPSDNIFSWKQTHTH